MQKIIFSSVHMHIVCQCRFCGGGLCKKEIDLQASDRCTVKAIVEIITAAVTCPKGYKPSFGILSVADVEAISKSSVETEVATVKQGPIGPKGDTGAQGPKGDKGDVGEKGVKGDTGAQGLTGATGPKGDKGDVGLKGDKGDMGAQGLTGTTGSKGDKGDPGEKGETGEQGLKGDTGATGAVGPVGPAGAGAAGCPYLGYDEGTVGYAMGFDDDGSANDFYVCCRAYKIVYFGYGGRSWTGRRCDENGNVGDKM